MTMEAVLFKNRKPDRALTFDEYRKQGGYETLRKVVGKVPPGEIVETVIESGLRGRGGAGFATGRKWSFLPKEGEGERYIVCNGDEMEPATYKDRVLVEANPHILVEGIILTAYANRVGESFIFIRNLYDRAASLLEEAIADARKAGFLGDNILSSSFSTDIKVHRSAGRYICGEETALLNALEGVRPNPRYRPPYPAIEGLWRSPTIINNIETLSNIPGIVANGAGWFQNLALTEEGDGTKLFCVSGKVERRECFELPMGVTLGDLIENHCGGMMGKKKFKAAIPGGASTKFLTADHLGVPLDFKHVADAGSRLGTGGVVVLDEGTCMVAVTLNLINFFARESCGWCTPCREGLPYVKDLLWRIENGEGRMGDVELLRDHVDYCMHAFCALAPGAVEPLESLLRLFGDEVKEHITKGKCPFE